MYKFILIVFASLITCSGIFGDDIGYMGFIHERDKIQKLQVFDNEKDIGIICDLDELLSIKDFSDYSNAVYLKLNGKRSVLSEAAIVAISKFDSLRVLALIDCKLDDSLGSLFKHANTIESLSLYGLSAEDVNWPSNNKHIWQVKLLSLEQIKISPLLYEDKTIRTLSLSDNQFNNIEIDFSRMSSLEKLFLRNCNITNLKKGFSIADSVRHIDLSFNRIKKLPKEWVGFENLEHLDLMGNRIEVLPIWLEESFADSKTFFDFSDNEISYIPDYIWEYGCRINLAGNVFSVLPSPEAVAE